MPNTSFLQRLTTAIESEAALRRQEIAQPIDTIYLGGGTPSIVPPELLASMTKPLRDMSVQLREFTIEANPEDVTSEHIDAWRNCGIDRISMGIQSFCDDELSLIGRRHTAKQALDAVNNLQQGGIINFSLDLIYGLPGQSLQSWERSLKMLLALRPPHFSAYMLTYEPRTRLYAMLRKGEITEASEDLVIQMYNMLISLARNAGYQHYEISNFALPGCEAKHNSSYWNNTPYLGLGPSAHSYDGMLRRINPANLNSYLEAIEAGLTACTIDEENDDNRFNDKLITALRTSRGLDLNAIEPSRWLQLKKDAEPWLKSGDLQIHTRPDGQFMSIIEPKWIISDAILSSLIQI